MKNVYLVFSWYAANLCTLIFSLLLLIYISTPQKTAILTGPPYQKYQALPQALTLSYNQTVDITKNDARVILIYDFFKEHNSPLANLADQFVKTADFYNLDFRLLPAIAMQESNGAKKIPKDSFNPFGYGIYGKKILRFNSFEEAINRVGRGLKEDYIDQGLTTPHQIMVKYTPPSLQKGGPWALGVTAFMEQIN